MPIQVALNAIKNGRMVILVDDEDRENEGDLVVAAELITAEHINFMVTNARGLVCLTLSRQRVENLKLPMMTSSNQSPKQTAFTVSIEAKLGVTTGISAPDRAHTIRVAVNPNSKADDIVSPGHIFPLKARDGGVLVRAGHTEGSVDLCKLAGLSDAGVICEIMRDDGTMARLDDLKVFSERFGIPIVTIQDIISYRMESECLVDEFARSKLPVDIDGKIVEFQMVAFQSKVDGAEHIALVSGPLGSEPLVRVHSECVTGDALGSLRCDCGLQLKSALKQIAACQNGVLVYMRKHEGRGIGLANKVKAYQLQDQGMDTVQANQHLGFKADLRHYGTGAQILKKLGIQKLKLLTNNPKKIVGLKGYGLEVIEQIAIESIPTQYNQTYLDTKKNKLGHTLNTKQPNQKTENLIL